MPNIRNFGTNYGGWTVDIDFIKDGDTVIDAGLGEDITFPLELQKYRDIQVVGVDPTEKSIKHVKAINPANFELLENAIAPEGVKEIVMYKNTNPEWVSESLFSNHSSVGEEKYTAKCISFKELRKKYKNIAVIKMDIEGAEYDCLKECIGIKQVCVEFHHFCLDDKSQADTEGLIDMMKDGGYAILKTNAQRTEITFIQI
jgi:FkbM family methyltransferase